MCDVSYEKSGEEDKLKVISRVVRKGINAKKDRKEYSKYNVSSSRTLLLLRLLLTILGLSLHETYDPDPKTI